MENSAMYRVCVQNGSSHEVLIEGSWNDCESVYDSYSGSGIVYMQEHCNHAHIPTPSLSGYWTLVMERE